MHACIRIFKSNRWTGALLAVHVSWKTYQEIHELVYPEKENILVQYAMLLLFSQHQNT